MKRPTILVAGPVVLFLLLAGYQIRLPGLYYDELFQAPVAIHMIEGSVNGNYPGFGSYEFHGHILPLMSLEYSGAIRAYMLAAAMWVFGIDVEVFRYTALLIFALGLIFFWHYAKSEYGLAAATIGIGLAASDPALVMLSRTEFAPTVFAFCMRGITLLLAHRWWRSGGKPIYLIGACFFAGIGFYDKINFVWFIIALLLCGGAAFAIDRDRPRLRLLPSLLGIVAGLLAISPFLIYSFYNNWPFLQKVSKTMTIADRLRAIPERSAALAMLVNGEGPSFLYFNSADLAALPIGRTLLMPLFIFSALVVIVVSISRRKWRLLIMPGMILLIACQIYATPARIGIHHWTMIHPLPHLLTGVAIMLLRERLAEIRGARVIGQTALALLLLATLTLNCLVVSRYHQLLARTGGRGLFSAAIYDLADKLQRDYPERKLRLMDWGLNHPLFFLSSGRLYTTEPYWEMLGEADNRARFEALLRDPQNLFIFNAPDGALFPVVCQEFERVLSAGRWRKTVEEKVFDRQSIWTYSIIGVRAGEETVGTK